MSQTPVFDEVVAEYPKDLWSCAPHVFGAPAHRSECPYDGYNWQVCTCGHWNTRTGEVYAL